VLCFSPLVDGIRNLVRAHAMHEMSIKQVDVRKLARAYVALALAQDEAKRYVSKHSMQLDLLPLVTSLDITARLLEEVLEEALPEKAPPCSPAITTSNMLM
jgi:hypothetical protein